MGPRISVQKNEMVSNITQSMSSTMETNIDASVNATCEQNVDIGNANFCSFKNISMSCTSYAEGKFQGSNKFSTDFTNTLDQSLSASLASATKGISGSVGDVAVQDNIARLTTTLSTSITQRLTTNCSKNAISRQRVSVENCNFSQIDGINLTSNVTAKGECAFNSVSDSKAVQAYKQAVAMEASTKQEGFTGLDFLYIGIALMMAGALKPMAEKMSGASGAQRHEVKNPDGTVTMVRDDGGMEPAGFWAFPFVALGVIILVVCLAQMPPKIDCELTTPETLPLIPPLVAYNLNRASDETSGDTTTCAGFGHDIRTCAWISDRVGSSCGISTCSSASTDLALLRKTLGACAVIGDERFKESDCDRARIIKDVLEGANYYKGWADGGFSGEDCTMCETGKHYAKDPNQCEALYAEDALRTYHLPPDADYGDNCTESLKTGFCKDKITEIPTGDCQHLVYQSLKRTIARKLDACKVLQEVKSAHIPPLASLDGICGPAMITKVMKCTELKEDQSFTTPDGTTYTKPKGTYQCTYDGDDNCKNGYAKCADKSTLGLFETYTQVKRDCGKGNDQIRMILGISGGAGFLVCCLLAAFFYYRGTRRHTVAAAPSQHTRAASGGHASSEVVAAEIVEPGATIIAPGQQPQELAKA